MLSKKTLPDVVVMDVAMPGMNGLEATRQIVRNVPSAKVLVLTSYGEDDYVTQLVGARATGYLLKQLAATDLLKAIREVHGGHEFFIPVTPNVCGNRTAKLPLPGRHPAKTGPLTSREAEALQLVAEGFANKQSPPLAISIKTVESIGSRR